MNKLINKFTISIVGISFFCLLFLGSSATDCFICDGSGRTDCIVCVNGKTEYMGKKQTCTFCNGRGSTTCTFCNGTGEN